MKRKINSYKLKALRAEYGLNQEEVAKYLEISKTSYRNKESNKCEFTLSEARELSLKFGRPMEEIFFSKSVIDEEM